MNGLGYNADIITLLYGANLMAYNAHFRCFRGCPGEYSLYDVIYTCPTCGGLLEVYHDVAALKQRR